MTFFLDTPAWIWIVVGVALAIVVYALFKFVIVYRSRLYAYTTFNTPTFANERTKAVEDSRKLIM